MTDKESDALDRVEIKELSAGEFVPGEGRFYAVVNGENVGEANRAFWPTRKLARMCANRYVIAQKMIAMLNAASSNGSGK